MDVRLPDGTVIKDVPDGMSRADLTAKLAGNGYDVSSLGAANSRESSLTAAGIAKAGIGAMAAGAGNLAAGALRGAGSIGATLLTPYDLIAGNTTSIGNPERRAAMTSVLGDIGADTNSLAFKGGQLGGEISGTLGAGGVLAQGAARTGMATPAVINALRSSGFTTGAAGGLGTRVAAGGAVGGASAGLVDPSSAGLGSAIGAALPPVIAGLGAAGAVAGNAWRKMAASGDMASAQALERALEIANPTQRQAIIEQLRNAETLVPGSKPTVAQALQSPEAGIASRVVYDSPGGASLRAKKVAQDEARSNALEGVAPTNALGPASARDSLGSSVAREMIPARKAEMQRVSALYDAVDPERAVRLQLPLDDFTAARDRFMGPGTFGQGKGTEDALRAAESVGLDVTPATVTKATPLKPGRATGDDMTLGAAVRQAGIHPDELRTGGYAGEVKYMKESKFGKNLVNKNGQRLDRLAEQMYERGYLESADSGELIAKLSDEMAGYPVLSKNADPSVLFGRARDANMPEQFVTPGKAEPIALDWRALQNFRGSLNDSIASTRTSGANKDAAALSGMKAALDGRVDEAGAQGLLKEGENFPLDAYARWTDANAAHAARKQRFDSGPMAGIFRNGPSGEPALQGKEIAQRAWAGGNADDVRSFKKLIANNPKLMGEFRGMVSTEGAGTADATGVLTTRFSKWVRQTLPGLKETFDPGEVDTLRRIAADIDRAAVANKAGTSLGGSNTYQNARNALDLGLLDSPALTRAANMLPGIRVLAAPALEALRGSARNTRATGLSNLLADSDRAATSLNALSAPNPSQGELLRLLGPAALRTLPVAASR